MKKQPLQDDLDHYGLFSSSYESDEELFTNGLDQSDDEDDRHYGNDPGNDELFFREW